MYQEADRSIGSQLYLVTNGQQGKLRGTKSSHRFTLMCLTLGTGDAVIFTITFAAKELNFIAHFIYDYRATEPFDPDYGVANQIGEGKASPGSTYYTFRGKRIPTVGVMS